MVSSSLPTTSVPFLNFLVLNEESQPFLSRFLQAEPENPASNTGSFSSAGFSTDRLPPDSSGSSDDDEAAVDLHALRDDDPDGEGDDGEEEEEGEDLFNDNYLM